MINGMTLLATDTSTTYWYVPLIVAIIIAFVIVALNTIGDYPSGPTFMILWGITTGIIFTLLWGLTMRFQPKIIETKYKVLIDDSVSWKDVEEKYEIVEVDGDIITIKERI